MVKFFGEISNDIVYYRSIIVLRHSRKVIATIMPILVFATLLIPLMGGDYVLPVIMLFLTVISFIVVFHRKPLGKNPFVKNEVYINISERTIILGNKDINFSVNTSAITKVIDYGDWWYLEQKKDANMSILCEKSLMVEGAAEDFEKIFADKIVKSDKYQEWIANR